MEVPELATGPITGMALGLRRLVAESEAFQRERGVGNSAEAEPHVKLFSYEVPDPKDIKEARPFAAIWPSALTWEKFAGGDRNHLRPSGDLVLLLTANDTTGSEVDETDADLAFAGWIDRVIGDVAKRAGQDDRLSVLSIVGADPLVRRSASKDDPGGAYLWAQFTVSWGDG